jgi:ATP-dependent RNA helicase MSS116
MFNVCRRGPASISRVLGSVTSTTRIPLTRPSTLSLSSFPRGRLALEARYLHVSSRLSYEAVAMRASTPQPSMNYVDQSTSKNVTKFEELIEHDMVHPNVVEEITKKMGHHTMTEVQSMTINQGLQGTDMYGY